MYESRLGENFRDLECRVTVLEERLNQSITDRIALHADVKEFIRDARVENKANRDAAVQGRAAAFATLFSLLLGMLAALIEQFAVHGGLKGP